MTPEKILKDIQIYRKQISWYSSLDLNSYKKLINKMKAELKRLTDLAFNLGII